MNKIVSTAPDLQPKQPDVDDLLLMGDQEEMETGGEGEQKKPEGGEEGEAGDSESDDDDDVQITIGDISSVPGSSYTRTPSYTRIGTTGTVGTEVGCTARECVCVCERCVGAVCSNFYFH